MKLLGPIIWLMSLHTLANAFKCDVDELSKYDFSKVKGDHSVTINKDTPPSKTDITWNVGICDTIKDIKECKGAEICGLTKVTLNLNTYLTEIIKLDGSDAKISYKPFDNDGAENSKGIMIKYDDFEWGDHKISAQVKFVCPAKDDDDDDSKDLDQLVLDEWDQDTLKLRMKTKSACINKKLSKPDDKKNADNGESWGWFTWIFIFFVLFLSIYIIGGAWFQYNKGNSIDFQTALKEVIENFIDVVKGLPIFIKEIIEKFTGNSNRGEYSAV